jgi:hypothetical protein
MSCIAAVAVIALVIEAIQLSSRKVRVAKSGGLFDRPEACHPIDYDAKREAEFTYLNVVLRLLRAREQACGERAHLRQGGDLIGQLMHRDIVVLGARHQEYVLCQPGREASRFVFLKVLHLTIHSVLTRGRVLSELLPIGGIIVITGIAPCLSVASRNRARGAAVNRQVLKTGPAVADVAAAN